MTTTLIAAPAVEPLTVAEATVHLRVDSPAPDAAYISTLITLAREYTEGIMNRALITQTWDLYLDRFPSFNEQPIDIPKPPLQSITYIKYTDTDGVEQTWSAAKYAVDARKEPATVRPAYGEVYPTTRAYENAVNIRFIAGYADSGASPIDLADNVPQPIKFAILLLVGSMYENRESTAPITITEVPMGYEMLIQPYRNFVL